MVIRDRELDRFLRSISKDELDRRLSSAREWLSRIDFQVEPLPDDLIDVADRHFTVRRDGDLRSDKGLRAYVRHFQTTYLEILKEMRTVHGEEMTHLVYDEFREIVDPVIQSAIDKWLNEKA